MQKDIVWWDAEYKGTTIQVRSKDPWGAQNTAAVEMGVPKSRQKHIRVKKK